MAVLDALCKVATAQAFTADGVSASSYDTGNITPKKDIAAGQPLALFVVITAIGTNTGSALFQVIESAAAALTSPKIRGVYELAAADIVVGATFIIPISQGPAASLRYVGFQADITGTVDFTLDAYIGEAEQVARLPKSYARGFAFDIS